MSRGILVFLALLVLGFGVAFTLKPVELAQVVDISLVTPTARTDFRAVYGGMEVGLGLFLLMCALRQHLVRVGLHAAAWALFGVATSRLVGMLADGFGVLMVVMFAVEIMAGGLAVWASVQVSRSPQPEQPSKVEPAAPRPSTPPTAGSPL